MSDVPASPDSQSGSVAIETDPSRRIRVRVEREEHRALVVVAGEVDHHSAELLQTALEQVVGDETVNELEVNVADVAFADSAFLNALAATRLVRECRLLVSETTPPVRRLIEVTGFDEYVELTEPGPPKP